MSNKKKYLIWGAIWSLCGGWFLAASQTCLAENRQPVAELIALVGNAEIKSPTETQFRAAKIKDAVYQQDQFRTLANSRAKLFFRDETIMVLSDNTTIDIANYQVTSQGERQSALTKILHGSLRFIVTKIIAGEKPSFEIQGTTAVLGVRGTDGIYETRSPDVIYFLSGKSILTILNTTTGQRLDLSPGNFLSALPGQPMRPRVITPLMRQRLLNNFKVASTSGEPPQTVLTPPPPGKIQQVGAAALGNPLVPQTDQFLNTLNPGAQGSGNLIVPLNVHHGSALPR